MMEIDAANIALTKAGIKSIDEFDLSTQIHAGGKTGSTKVKEKEKDSYWQLKQSIGDALLSRQAKAQFTDRENFGEVIASRVARALAGDESAPDVRLVYDQRNQKILIASKYLTGSIVQTLNDYAYNKTDKSVRPKQFAFVKTIPKSGQIALQEQSQSFSDGIAKGLALSAALGDHDVNPGNMMFVKDADKEGKYDINAKERIVRIDFGHAFNDLINTLTIFGGGLKDKNNEILDFLNREKVGGVKFGDPSKLWRSYAGMMPSQELASAFKALSEKQGNVAAAIEEVRLEFNYIYDQCQSKLQTHIQSSLDQIGNSISNGVVEAKAQDSQIGSTGVFQSVFISIENFVLKNCKDMAYVSKLMQLQVDIDDAINTHRLKETFDKIQKNYDELDPKPTTFIKTSASKAAFKGGLDGYISQRKIELTKMSIRNLREDHAQSLLNEFKEYIESKKQDPNDLKAKDKEYNERLLALIGGPGPSTLRVNKLIKTLDSMLSLDKSNSYLSMISNQINKILSNFLFISGRTSKSLPLYNLQTQVATAQFKEKYNRVINKSDDNTKDDSNVVIVKPKI